MENCLRSTQASTRDDCTGAAVSFRRRRGGGVHDVIVTITGGCYRTGKLRGPLRHGGSNRFLTPRHGHTKTQMKSNTAPKIYSIKADSLLQ